jgi:hypothetical protein
MGHVDVDAQFLTVSGLLHELHQGIQVGVTLGHGIPHVEVV